MTTKGKKFKFVIIMMSLISKELFFGVGEIFSFVYLFSMKFQKEKKRFTYLNLWYKKIIQNEWMNMELWAFDYMQSGFYCYFYDVLGHGTLNSGTMGNFCCCSFF